MTKIKKDQKMVIGVGLIISFALLVFTVSLFFSSIHNEKMSTRLSPEKVNNLTKEEIISFITQNREDEPTIHGYYVIPFAAFIGLLVGTVVYYIMSEKINQQEFGRDKNTKIILNFLNSHERKVIDTLIEHEGRVQQYELSHLPNLNKVKTHRILVNLEQKGIIHKEKLGKINKIVLDKELYEVLK